VAEHLVGIAPVAASLAVETQLDQRTGPLSGDLRGALAGFFQLAGGPTRLRQDPQRGLEVSAAVVRFRQPERDPESIGSGMVRCAQRGRVLLRRAGEVVGGEIQVANQLASSGAVFQWKTRVSRIGGDRSMHVSNPRNL